MSDAGRAWPLRGLLAGESSAAGFFNRSQVSGVSDVTGSAFTSSEVTCPLAVDRAGPAAGRHQEARRLRCESPAAPRLERAAYPSTERPFRTTLATPPYCLTASGPSREKTDCRIRRRMCEGR